LLDHGADTQLLDSENCTVFDYDSTNEIKLLLSGSLSFYCFYCTLFSMIIGTNFDHLSSFLIKTLTEHKENLQVHP
jgi:hypothetical protein